jgi:hypothetical protein
VLGVAYRKPPPRMAHRALRVAHGGQALTPCHIALILDGEQGNGSTGKIRQVALIELREAWWAAPSRVSSRSSLLVVVNQASSCPGQRGESGCPCGPHSVHVQTHGMGSHVTREPLCGQSSEARPRVRSESRDGVTRHNGAIHRPRGWRRGSRSYVKNREEMNQHFIH